MAAKGSNLVLLCLSCCFFFTSSSHSDTDTIPPSSIFGPADTFFTDTILQGQLLRDWQHLVSADGMFRLSFFSPGNSRNRYLGILYNIPDDEIPWPFDRKAVWVANRNTPIDDTSGILMIDRYGRLIISCSRCIVPIVLCSAQAVSNVSGTLLNSGNFVLRELNSDGSTKRVLWQSFDYPTDMLLPGMKLGRNFKTGHNWSLTSWISDDVPAEGSFTLGGDPNGTSQLFIWWQGKGYWSSGLWKDGNFESVPYLSFEQENTFSCTSNENETYFTFSGNKNHTISRFTMHSAGEVSEGKGIPVFGRCFVREIFGGNCLGEIWPKCRKPNIWFAQRRGYMSHEGFKFDDGNNSSISDCWAKCLNNCSCVAYASAYDNQTGCKIWSQGMSFREEAEYTDKVIYVLGTDEVDLGRRIFKVVAILFVLVSCFSCYLIQRKHRIAAKRKKEQEILLYLLGDSTTHSSKSGKSKKLKRDGKMSHELRFFSFESIASATENFATTNKLGEGGYGPVYKGKLHDQEIAIKRLSINSGQGVEEFKNELILIAKLQHTNLVRLVGCCIQREEKILIYEYMANKSLDFFLFDPMRKNLLDWKKRFNIIDGIAQGLLYLHKYSGLRIIHRDLKASNILLDGEMNPKISDFGMARKFRQNESQANTKRIVGTYGYMSPEYAMKGIFSMKSDVFSFGVLLLEIVSGRKNNSYHHDEYPINLIVHAWELWQEGRVLELMDPTLGDSYQNNEVLRCIHVSLLCVQDRPADRPIMSDVVSMINNMTIPLSAPKQPAFFTNWSVLEAEITKHNLATYSPNKLSISDMEGR